MNAPFFAEAVARGVRCLVYVTREIANIAGKSNLVGRELATPAKVVEPLGDDFFVGEILECVDDFAARWLIDKQHAIRAHA